MGPMGPRGLGPWALWAPGTLGPHLDFFQYLTKVVLRTYFEPLDRSWMIPERSDKI